MKRAVLAFVLGLAVGVQIGGWAQRHRISDSPWPAPTPSPRLISIDWAEEARKVAQMRCDTEKAQIAVDCAILWTGKPNPCARERR